MSEKYNKIITVFETINYEKSSHVRNGKDLNFVKIKTKSYDYDLDIKDEHIIIYIDNIHSIKFAKKTQKKFKTNYLSEIFYVKIIFRDNYDINLLNIITENISNSKKLKELYEELSVLIE
jgi:hypothetical protein